MTTQLSKKDLDLIDQAKKHSKLHYKKNQTSMACILRTAKGNFYSGINIKYKPVWKCICAERVAIAKALEARDEKFDTIVTVKYQPETKDYSVMNMCGECRQIAIFHRPLRVIINNKGKISVASIDQVFPYPYS